ncbi:MAG: response regulator [Chthoniobacterales bacterium]
MTPIRILLADDHPIVRQGLRQIIEADKGLEIVAEANNGNEALALIAEHKPGVAVLDIDMPETDGFAVVRALPKQLVRPEIVFLTMHSDEEYFQAAMDLGIKGYVLKDSAVTDIVSAIKSVAAGRPYLSPALSGQLLERRRVVEELDKEHPGLSALTLTERRILKLIAADKSSKEIGAKLSVSPRTVEKHRANICAKLKLHGTLALVRFALTHKARL